MPNKLKIFSKSLGLNPSAGFTLISKERGFTLIELLVTIAIISVISVIAVALLGNVQADARDSKRKAELEALSNALEVNKTSGGGTYNPLLANQLAGGVFPGGGAEALDPQGYPYCIKASTTTIPPTNSVIGAGVWASGTTACGEATYLKISGTVPANTTVSWTLCTRLENKGTPQVFCRTNRQ